MTKLSTIKPNILCVCLCERIKGNSILSHSNLIDSIERVAAYRQTIVHCCPNENQTTKIDFLIRPSCNTKFEHCCGPAKELRKISIWRDLAKVDIVTFYRKKQHTAEVSQKCWANKTHDSIREWVKQTHKTEFGFFMAQFTSNWNVSKPILYRTHIK